MKIGTKILIVKPGSGCLGATSHVGVVTVEAATHGLYDHIPGYNVALLNGQIWRINQDAKVKILYRPPTV